MEAAAATAGTPSGRTPEDEELARCQRFLTEETWGRGEHETGGAVAGGGCRPLIRRRFRAP